MKKKKNTLYMDSQEDMDLVEVEMMDDGDWEYIRVGIGKYDNKVFLVDLDEGKESREMEYVKDGMSISEVLKIGIECGVWKEIDWGYDEDDKYRVCWDLDGDEFDKFKERVGVEVGW